MECSKFVICKFQGIKFCSIYEKRTNLLSISFKSDKIRHMFNFLIQATFSIRILHSTEGNADQNPPSLPEDFLSGCLIGRSAGNTHRTGIYIALRLTKALGLAFRHGHNYDLVMQLLRRCILPLPLRTQFSFILCASPIYPYSRFVLSFYSPSIKYSCAVALNHAQTKHELNQILGI